MTISSEDITAGPFVGNGVTTAFTHGFPATGEQDIAVYVTDLAGVITQYTQAAGDYIWSPIGDGGGISLGVALPTGWTLVIISNREAIQNTEFNNQGGFFPRIHEAAFDKLTILINQLKRFFLGVLRVPAAETIPELPAAAMRANKILFFDAIGDPGPVEPNSVIDVNAITDIVVTAVEGEIAVLVANAVSMIPPAAGFPQFDSTIDLGLNSEALTGVVYVHGYSIYGDGAAGFFELDVNDTTSTDNKGTRIVDSQNPRTGTWKRVGSVGAPVNVAWFGVSSNTGSSVDLNIALTRVAAAVAEAGATSRALYLPEAEYTNLNLVLSGDGDFFIIGNNTSVNGISASVTSGTGAIRADLGNSDPKLVLKNIKFNAGAEATSPLVVFQTATSLISFDCDYIGFPSVYQNVNSVSHILTTNIRSIFINGTYNCTESLVGTYHEHDLTMRTPRFQFGSKGIVISPTVADATRSNIRKLAIRDAIYNNPIDHLVTETISGTPVTDIVIRLDDVRAAKLLVLTYPAGNTCEVAATNCSGDVQLTHIKNAEFVNCVIPTLNTNDVSNCGLTGCTVTTLTNSSIDYTGFNIVNTTHPSFTLKRSAAGSTFVTAADSNLSLGGLDTAGSIIFRDGATFAGAITASTQTLSAGAGDFSSLLVTGVLTVDNLINASSGVRLGSNVTTSPRIFFGSGTPEGVITGRIGSTFHRLDGGAVTSFYVKESGTGNTGWVAK